MIIATGSNVVSAGYIVLTDLFLPAVAVYLVRMFLSSWNVKAIYRDRRSVELQHVAPFSLIHQEVSEKKVGLLVAIFSSLIVACGVAGGFSIVGISQEPSVDMKAPVLFEIGTSDDVIDFTKHVSEDRKTVSRTFLLARNSTMCSSISVNKLTQFAAMSDDPKDVDKVHLSIWETEETRCLMREEGFAEERTKSFPVGYIAPRKAILSCKFSVKANKPGKLVKADLSANDDCPVKIHDCWCARYKYNVCIGSVETEVGFTTIDIQYAQDEGDPSTSKVESFGFSGLYTKEKIGSISIRSNAYLSAVGAAVVRNLGTVQLTLLRMQTDADIQKVKDPVEVTKVNLVFLASTLGPALALLSLSSIITYMSWRKYVSEPGLQNYNPFYSAHDMLLFASQEASQESSRRNQEWGNSAEGVVFGVSRKMPHVGPLWESDDEGSEFFAETELEGTTHIETSETET